MNGFEAGGVAVLRMRAPAAAAGRRGSGTSRTASVRRGGNGGRGLESPAIGGGSSFDVTNDAIEDELKQLLDVIAIARALDGSIAVSSVVHSRTHPNTG